MEQSADMRASMSLPPWSEEEHARFLNAIERVGYDFNLISAILGNRTPAEVQLHYRYYWIAASRRMNYNSNTIPHVTAREIYSDYNLMSSYEYDPSYDYMNMQAQRQLLAQQQYHAAQFQQQQPTRLPSSQPQANTSRRQPQRSRRKPTPTAPAVAPSNVQGSPSNKGSINFLISSNDGAADKGRASVKAEEGEEEAGEEAEEAEEEAEEEVDEKKPRREPPTRRSQTQQAAAKAKPEYVFTLEIDENKMPINVSIGELVDQKALDEEIAECKSRVEAEQGSSDDVEGAGRWDWVRRRLLTSRLYQLWFPVFRDVIPIEKKELNDDIRFMKVACHLEDERPSYSKEDLYDYASKRSDRCGHSNLHSHARPARNRSAPHASADDDDDDMGAPEFVGTTSDLNSQRPKVGAMRPVQKVASRWSGS